MPSPPAQPVLYSWSWAARWCPWRPPDQEVASNYVTPTDEPREGNNKNKRLEERGPRLGKVVYQLFVRCQHCKRHKHFNTSLSRAYWTIRNFMFQVANFLAEGLVLLSALVVTLNAPPHAACNSEDYTSRGVLCTPRSFSWKKKQTKTCTCCGSPVQIGERNNQSCARCNSHVWNMNTGYSYP